MTGSDQPTVQSTGNAVSTVSSLPVTESSTAYNIGFRNSRWMSAARITWAIIVVFDVAFLLLNYPAWYNQLSTGINPVTNQSIGNIGLPLTLHAAYVVTLNGLLLLFAVLMGAVLFLRKSDNWMVLAVSLGLIIFMGTSHVIYSPIMALKPQIITGFLSIIGDICVFAVLFLFPDGQFYPRWHRWPFMFAVIFDVIVAAGFYFAPDSTLVETFVLVYAQGIYIAVSAIALIGQVQRFRKVATPVQQQQTKWIVFGIGIALIGHIYLYITDFLLKPDFPAPFQGLYYLSIPLLSLFIPLSVLIVTYIFSFMRYKLWEVDLFINRGLVVGAMSVILGAIFIGTIALIDSISKALTGHEQPVVSVIASVLLIGGLFDPTHRRVRYFIERRLYGLKVDLNQGRSTSKKHRRHLRLPADAPANFGVYEVKSLIGRGGMGNVYLARHTTLNRDAAIKMLPLGLAENQQTRARFEQEASIVAQLRHPNIVQMFDFGELDCSYYMVMEYIDGQALSAYIKRNRALPVAHVQSIVHDLAGALDHAHQHGYIHRDLKPSNVMLQPKTDTKANGFPYRAILMDFGIARIMDEEERVTQTNLLGTLEYIAPEQIRASKEVTHRADIYALGVMLYQMLTGQLPFTGDNAGVLVFAHLQRPPADPRTIVADIPDNIARAVLRALEKDPAQRFDSAGELAAMIVA